MNTSGSGKGSAFRWSIGAKLTIAFLILALVPMSVTAYYNLTQGQREVAQVAEENLLVLSQSVASEVNQLLVENLRTSATLAGDPLVVQYLTSSGEARRTLEPLIYQTLQNFAETHPDFPNPGILNADGIAMAVWNVPPEVVGTDYSDRDYYVAVKQAAPFISDIIVGRVTSQDGVFLAYPVFTEEGEVVGMSNMKLDVENNVRKTIDNIAVGAEGIAYLVDQDGVVIAHPNRELLYHSLGELLPEAAEVIASSKRFGIGEDGQPRIPESLGMDDLASELMAARRGGSYRYYSPLDRRYHIVGYTPLEAHSWTVVVDLPEDQFLAPLQRLETFAWISVGVVGVAALVISVLLARGITRPITRLASAAVAVENDRPFDPADIADITSGRDETAHLGRVFSAMVLALRRRVGELRTVYEIGQDITAALEVDETLQAVLDRVYDVIVYDAAEITLFDQQEDALIVTAWSGKNGFDDTRGASYRIGEGFTGLIGQEKRGLLVPDIQAQMDQRAVAEQIGEEVPVRSLLGVPLLIQDRLVGTLELVHSRVGAFDENDQRLLETIAPQAAIAIEKAQQVRERERQLQNQIERLRIEIDHTKRERQVQAITETDYFQELARQAAELRKRAGRE
ncbi:MAG TPA: GAF domain-containing protein [Chloroflexi bacterium]|nr:GAF domain-containing protein [Chloroflexota bacterium]